MGLWAGDLHTTTDHDEMMNWGNGISVEGARHGYQGMEISLTEIM